MGAMAVAPRAELTLAGLRLVTTERESSTCATCDQSSSTLLIRSEAR